MTKYYPEELLVSFSEQNEKQIWYIYYYHATLDTNTETLKCLSLKNNSGICVMTYRRMWLARRPQMKIKFWQQFIKVWWLMTVSEDFPVCNCHLKS